MKSLVTLAEIKDFLNIKTGNIEEDGRLSNLAIQASTLIENYCSRKFEANTYIEFFNGGKASIFVDNCPIVQVHEVYQYDGTSYALLNPPGQYGQINMLTGDAHTVTTQGSPIINSRVKAVGMASAFFDGNSTITVQSSDDFNFDTESFTIELFARLSSNTTTKSLIDAGLWSLNIANTTISFATSDLSLSANTPIQCNKFYHFAVVKNANSIKLYTDGNAIASAAYANSISSNSLVIGSQLLGYLDSIRISHQAEYSANFAKPEYSIHISDGTKLLLPFNSDFKDYSRHINDYTFSPDTGQINFDIKDGAESNKLGFFPSRFKDFPRNIKVIYKGGFEDVPEDIKLAVLELVKISYKGISGTASASTMGQSRQSYGLARDDFPPQVRRILSLYRNA